MLQNAHKRKEDTMPSRKTVEVVIASILVAIIPIAVVMGVTELYVNSEQYGVAYRVFVHGLPFAILWIALVGFYHIIRKGLREVNLDTQRKREGE